jgi:hypothetical protein
MKNCIIKGFLSLFVILFDSLAYAGTYIGVGINLSDDKYSTKTTQSDSSDFSNLSSAITASAENIILYDGSKEDLEQLLSETYGFVDVDLYLERVTADTFSLSQCQLNGVLVPHGCVVGDYTPSTTEAFMQVINSVEAVQSNVGESYYKFLENAWQGVVSFNFADENEMKKFQTLLGKNLMDTMMGKTDYTIEELGNAFAYGFANPAIFQNTDLDVGDGSNVGVLPLNATNAAVSQEAIFEAILRLYALDGSGGGDGSGGNIIANKKASKSNTGLFVSVGYAEMKKKWYYGFEGVVDLGNNVVGNQNNNEFELKHNYTLNLLAKGGYSLFPNMVNYANLGFAFRKYSVSGFGVEKSSLKPFAVMGLGVEFFVNNKINIFTEYNHLIMLSKIKTDANNLNFNVKSNKISMGIRYYLHSNLFSGAKNKVSEERMAKYSNYNSNGEKPNKEFNKGKSEEENIKPVKNSIYKQGGVLPKKQINKTSRKSITKTQDEPVFFDEQLEVIGLESSAFNRRQNTTNF